MIFQNTLPSEGSLFVLLFREAEVLEFLIGPEVEVLNEINTISCSKAVLTCWEIFRMV